MTHANSDAQKRRRYLRELAGPCQSKAAQRLLARLAAEERGEVARPLNLPGRPASRTGPDPPGFDDVRLLFSRYFPPHLAGMPCTLEEAEGLERLIAAMRDPASPDYRLVRKVCGRVALAFQRIYHMSFPVTTGFLSRAGLLDYAEHLIVTAPNYETGAAAARRFLVRFHPRSTWLDALFAAGFLSPGAMALERIRRSPAAEAVAKRIRQHADSLREPHEILHVDRFEDPDSARLYEDAVAACGNWRLARTQAGFDS